MDIFEDYVVVYLKKRLIPTVLIHDIKKKENKLVSLDAVGEFKPRVNKVFKIKK
jgi:5-methylcytosine-specific restriction endonuclease McrBC regulatory subunit McrC